MGRQAGFAKTTRWATLTVNPDVDSVEWKLEVFTAAWSAAIDIVAEQSEGKRLGLKSYNCKLQLRESRKRDQLWVVG